MPSKRILWTGWSSVPRSSTSFSTAGAIASTLRHVFARPGHVIDGLGRAIEVPLARFVEQFQQFSEITFELSGFVTCTPALVLAWVKYGWSMVMTALSPSTLNALHLAREWAQIDK